MTKRLLLLSIIMLLELTHTLQAISVHDLRFNEIMISNIDGLMEEYDYPDSWVELYNTTSTAIDIKGMKISTSDKDAYTFSSSIKVPAKGYLVIFCDKKASGKHTSFRLDAEGGTLTLKSGSTVIDNIDYPAMLAPEVGYARISTSSETWKWEKTSTPGSANKEPFANEILPDPAFSQTGRVMTGPLHVDIKIPTGNYPADTRIYLTLNGEEPTTNSQSAKSFSFDIKETTVIRAKLISSSAISGRSVSQSYIFHPRKNGLPIISLLTDSVHLFDEKYGLFSEKVNANSKANYEQNWRRPINMEYLGTAGEQPWFNQLGETGISGASSRAAEQKSLKLYAHKRFGRKHYNGKMWDDKPLVDKTKSLILRNGGSTTYRGRIFDAYAQRLFGKHIDNLDWQAYEPVAVYLNGQYYGFLGLRERSNEDYVWANYDGEEDIELVDHYSNTANANYKQLRNLCSKSTSKYSDFEPLIDVDEWCNILCLQIFTANTDWPFNNMSLWRKLDGGKWRWIVKDIDYIGWAVRPQLTTDVLNFNYFRYLTMSGPKTEQEYKTANNSPNAFYLFKKLLPMAEIRDILVDKLAIALGDYLKPSVSTAMIWEMHDEAIDELDATFRYYNPKSSGTRVTARLTELEAFMTARPRKVYEHITEYYKQGNVIPMTIATHNNRIQMNEITLTEGDWDGAWFSDRELRISSGASNVGWKMTTYQRQSNGQMKKNSGDKSWAQQTVTLKLKDYANCDSVAWETYTMGKSEFDIRLEELAINTNKMKDWSQSSTISLAEPKCAYANISGIEHLPESKFDNMHAWMDFYDAQGNYFRKKILLNLQGGTDANATKKNLALSFCEDEWLGDETPDIAFGEWVMQDEFHLKAFYNDYFRGIPAIGYKLYNQMTLSLGTNARPWQRGLSETNMKDPELSIYDEARCIPDAFPCVIYVNGAYYGTYAWQLKKQRKNMNQTKNIATHIHLDGTLNDKQLFEGDVNWTKFEIRNPKNLYLMDGSDYDGENPGEIMDATSAAYEGKKKQVRCAEVKQHIKALSTYYSEITSLEAKGKSKTEIKKAIEQRFDVTSMIDYMVFALATSNYDGFSKNWQWFTYNGEKWFVAPYDLDLTFGYNEEALELWPASQSSKKYDYRMLNVDESGPMHWVKAYYWDKVRDRWNQLRENGIFTPNNIMDIVNDWYNRVGDTNREAEWGQWPESPCLVSYTDSQQRIRQWIEERLELEDDYLNREGIEYELTLSNAEWATLCVGFGFDVPQGLEVYAVNSVQNDGSTLQLTQVNSTEGNLPYLAHGAAGTYRLRGSEMVSSQNHTNGLLTGTLTDIYAPKDSYVLQQLDGRLAFYHVADKNSIMMKANHAYLSLSTSTLPGCISLPDEGTAIQECQNDMRNVTGTYNIWGVRTFDDAKGIVFSNGEKVFR